VSVSGGDCDSGVSVAEVDCCSWGVGVVTCSVTELTPKVPTPAGDLSVVE